MSEPKQNILASIEPAYREVAAHSPAQTPEWLKAKRQAAEQAWLERGLPTKRDERWKYTSLNLLGEGAWEQAGELQVDELPLRSRFAAYPGDKSVEIAMINGVITPTWSTSHDKVKVSTLRQALESGDRVRLEAWSKLLGGNEDFSKFPFAALNASFARDVVWVDIAANAVLENPILVSQFSMGTESLSAWTSVASKIIVTASKNSQAGLVEWFAGEGRVVSIPMVEVRVEQNAKISHARLNLDSESTARFSNVRADLARDSFYENYQFVLGSRMTREDLVIRLNESGADAVLDGFSLCDGKRHVDHSTAVEHVAPHTTSAQLYKSVLNDEAKAIFNGRVRIHRDAQQSNAAQLNNNLLLSAKAEADSKPELEIDADDVKASHGATIGQIDPEHVFYLRARAIPEEKAIAMLSRGFALDVVFRIRDQKIRAACEQVVGSAFDRSMGGAR